MYNQQQRAVTNPVTQQGIVVVNARKDSYSIASRIDSDRGTRHTDEDFHVLTHELAFTHSVDYREELGEESVGIVTSSNGILDIPDIESEAGFNKVFEERLSGTPSTLPVRFVGVAATRALHDSYNSVNNEEDCTVQIGGMCTVLNNGPRSISANDWVMWDTPTTKRDRVYGAPDTKAQFTVDSFSYIKDNHDELLDDWHDAPNGLNAKMLIVSMAMSGMPFPQIFSTENIVIGRAMNNSAPGAQLDILLGAHCM